MQLSRQSLARRTLRRSLRSQPFTRTSLVRLIIWTWQQLSTSNATPSASVCASKPPVAPVVPATSVSGVARAETCQDNMAQVLTPTTGHVLIEGLFVSKPLALQEQSLCIQREACSCKLIRKAAKASGQTKPQTRTVCLPHTSMQTSSVLSAGLQNEMGRLRPSDIFEDFRI